MREIVRSVVKIGVASVASLLGWVVAGKLLAVELGAAGVGTFGLLRQLLLSLTVLASFNGQTALVQGIASAPDSVHQARYADAVLKIQLSLCAVVALVLVVGAPWLGPVLLPHANGIPMLRWSAIALFATVGQSYVVGLLNGHRLVDQLVRAQLVGPVAVVALVLPMSALVRHGYAAGFVLMLAGPPLLVTGAGGLAARRAAAWPERTGWSIDRSAGTRFVRMSTALLIAAVVTTGAQYFQSWIVARYRGLDVAGQYWTAWTLSMSYVTLVLGSYGTYYMPNLSRLTVPADRVTLIRTYMRLCLLVMPVLVTAVILVKPLVIHLLFSASLLPAVEVMRWMLIGDFFKAVSWVLSFPMIAYGHLKWFFWSEVLFSVGYAGACAGWLALGYGVAGLGALFLAMYVLYLAVMLVFVRSKLGYRIERGELARFAAGLAVILVVSVLTWDDKAVRVRAIAVGMLLSAAYVGWSEPRLRWKSVRTLMMPQ